MLSYTAIRATIRIPWMRENLEGLKFLRTTFYLLLALHRAKRFADFNWALRVFFEMAHSFAQYGRSHARDTVDRLLRIPWYRERRGQVLRLILAYNQVVAEFGLSSPRAGPPDPENLRRATGDFVRALKLVIGFDEDDEARVRSLKDDPEALEAVMERFFGAAIPD